MSKKKGEEVSPEENSQVMTDALTNAMLRETIAKLEDQKVKLLLNIKGLVEKLTQQKQDQSDIYYYLNKKLDDNYEVIAALEDQILTEQGDREVAEKVYEKRIEDMEKEHSKEVHNLNTRILDLEEKLQILKQFSSEKESIDANLRELLETLENEREQYRIYTEDMERKAALDRERVKHEYEVQIEQYRADIQKKVDEKLSKAVKNTRTVNQCMQQELRYQSHTVQNMLKFADGVISQDKNLRQELSIAQSNESEIVHRLATYQRIIKQLNERIASEEEAQVVLKTSYESMLQGKDEECKKAKTEVEELHAFIDKENKQLDDVWKALSETYAYVQIKKQRKHRPTHEPIDHDEVLTEVFYRLVKKNPNKFRNMFRVRARSSLSTAGSDAMSTCSSKDSLLFPKINSARSGIGLGLGGAGNGSEIPASIDLSSDSMYKPVLKPPPFKKYGGKMASGEHEEGDDSDRDRRDDSSSVVTGIPAWDSNNKATSDAQWWLNQESVGTERMVEDSNSMAEVGAPDSSMQIGFAEDSLASNTIGPVGGDIGILSSLCEVHPESHSHTEKPIPPKVIKKELKDAGAQTEGRVSVFPVGSAWKSEATTPALLTGSREVTNALMESSVKAISNGVIPPPAVAIHPPALAVGRSGKPVPKPPVGNQVDSSPIKAMMKSIPHYMQHGNSKEDLVKARESKRRILHGRKIVPLDNSKERNYLRREGSGSSQRSSSTGSSRPRPKKQHRSPTQVPGKAAGRYSGYLSDEDSQTGFSICGSSVASFGSPISSVGSRSAAPAGKVLKGSKKQSKSRLNAASPVYDGERVGTGNTQLTDSTVL